MRSNGTSEASGVLLFEGTITGNERSELPPSKALYIVFTPPAGFRRVANDFLGRILGGRQKIITSQISGERKK